MHRTRRPLWLVVAALAFAAGMAPGLVITGGTPHLEPVSGEELAKDTEVYRQHETTIANPFMEGRAPGTKGNRIVADYIEWNYRKLGLQPAFPEESKAADGTVVESPFSSYRQVFKAPASKRPGDSMKVTVQEASYTVGGAGTGLRAGDGFNVIGYSGNGDVTGPIVFAGYGVNIEEKNYETYAEGTDLKGKIVILMRFEPMDAQGHSLWAKEGQTWSGSAALEAKLSGAVKRHAAGIILVSPPGADDPRVKELGDLAMGGRQYDVPVIMMSPAAADLLVKRADTKGRSLLDLRKVADQKGGVIELSPKAEFHLNAKIQKVDLMTDNVGAVLRGKGKLADEYVVIGSHYDHVGYGYFGSVKNEVGVIHPGADDNASGTSANLLVAKTLSEAYAELPADADARSVLFLCFSAEESGLIGSHYYTKHMIAPADKHYLMLNMDMVGRLRDGKLDVEGVTSADGLIQWLKPYLDQSGFTVKTDAKATSKSMEFASSDHFEFFKAKVPDIFFFTGFHSEYHTPRDTVDLINFEGGAKVADLVARLTFDIARRTEPLVFSSGESEKPEKADNPHAGAANGDSGALTGVKVRFGIMPDYSYDAKPGVMISNLSSDKGLAAEKAGLKEGDLMTKWDDNKFAGVEDWMEVMSKYKPGDKVKVTFIRDGKEQVVEATLTSSEVAKPAKN